jgi:tetratricopeptide (TPR) repeat protein
MQNLGYVLLTKGEPGEAVGVLEEALPILERIYGPDHFGVATTRTNLGDALQRSGRYREALTQYERSERILRSTLGVASADYGTLVNNLAYARWKLDELDDAARGFEEAAEIYAAAVGERHPWVGIAINNLAQIRAQQRRHDEARELALHCRAILEESLPAEHYLLARPITVLAEVDAALGDFASALDRLGDATALTSDLTLLHPDRIRVALVRARCHASAGDKDGARSDVESYLLAAHADSVSDSASLDPLRELLAGLD